jgi:hypothetical protein
MSPEVHAKFAQVLQLSSQIVPLTKLKRTPEEAAALQSLLRRRAELLGTLPGLRVVAGKDVP